jgi:radial spoke head protein 3
MEVQTEKYVE